MRTRLFFASLASAASLLMLAPFATSAATISLDSPAQADDLSDPRTVTVIDGKAYVMNHFVLDNDERVKALYRLDSPETPATLLHSETGALGDDERIAEYDGDLYHTITRSRGNTVQVFRSTDDGDTWEQVADVGFASTAIKNEVKAMFSSVGRLYVVVAQKHRYDDVKKRVAIWSSTDGDTWKKSVIHWDRNQTLVDATVWNDRPFLLVQGKAAGQTPAVRLYTTFQSNGSKLQQSAETNLLASNPITTATDFVATDDALFATGANTDDETVSLVSTDGGIGWEATDEPFEQVVMIGTTLFATSGNTLYYSVDGTTWAETTFSFEANLGMDADSMNRVFGPSQDNSGTAIRVWSADDASDAECWWSADGVSWDELATCAPALQPQHRAPVQFGDFWYGIKGKKIHSLFRFESL